MAPEVVIFGSGSDWHGRALMRALAGRGASVACVPLADCAFTVGSTPGGLHLPGVDGVPELAVVRFIAAGSLEQVTLRLGVLHALRELGTRVVNDARAIERCVDKSMTSFLLARAGLPTPPAWACGSLDQARAVVLGEAGFGRELVLKPLFGAQGRGLRQVAAIEDLPGPEEVGGVYYLQRFIGSESAWHDWRVLVAAGEAISAMRRVGMGWVTNIRRGARAVAASPDGELAALALAAAAAVGADYAGVDLMRDPKGDLQVLEVNSMPAWKGLQGVTEVDIADRLAAVLLACARRPMPVAAGS